MDNKGEYSIDEIVLTGERTEKSLSQCQFVLHKPHIDCSEPQYSRGQAVSGIKEKSTPVYVRS